MPNIVKMRGNTESFGSNETIRSIQNAVLNGYRTHQEKERLIEEVSESIVKNILMKEGIDSEIQAILTKDEFKPEIKNIPRDEVDSQVMDTLTIHYCIKIKI